MSAREEPSGRVDLDIQRLRIGVEGAVQGVGFRPYVYRLALDCGLAGWVMNTVKGVTIEIEGKGGNIERFLDLFPRHFPPRAVVRSWRYHRLEPSGLQRFTIVESDGEGDIAALVLPDIAPCDDCLREIFDPSDRRFLYPFTNCTNCGPRFTIIEALPYDRPNTSMKRFAMCSRCLEEYHDPGNRRFHAQPNACPRCGPRLTLLDAAGNPIRRDHDALLDAAQALKSGQIIAAKGVGGFHLMADARNDDAIRLLRRRKRREEKPFALMFPDMVSVERACLLCDEERALLTSAEAPIVLLRRRDTAEAVAHEVAPRNPYLGIMLPPSPLHHILLRETGFPVVATSGNLSDEPICIDENEALQRLAGIADMFLVHDRPIVRPVDDSIVLVVAGRRMIVRRARGYAPLPVAGTRGMAGTVAYGGHLKNSVALSSGRDIFLSQHIGDLDTLEAKRTYRRAIADMRALFGVEPRVAVCDAHPDYASTQEAESSGLPVVRIQHHHAHACSCMAEHGLRGEALAVVWDGTGYGTDGTIWGGEFLVVRDDGFQRFAAFRRFPLPGGERAVREPRRSALGLLFEMKGESAFTRADFPTIRAFSRHELRILKTMLEKRVNTVDTTSVGRLFDAVASMAGIRQRCTFDGQAAMELEWAAVIETPTMEEQHGTGKTIRIVEGPAEAGPEHPSFIVDWGPFVLSMIEERRLSFTPGIISRRFHDYLAIVIVEIARRAGIENVVLSGGCFQNRVLLGRSFELLATHGFRPYRHEEIPTNDGGISLGQAVAARAILERKRYLI
ncbi:MAG: carbamoyltransferase HypF [Bacteroidota bacterium]|nr:carbamoyltransferase HypF [Bacteroidota bacterium]